MTDKNTETVVTYGHPTSVDNSRPDIIIELTEQGPQGPQGEKGDKGDITPAMENLLSQTRQAQTVASAKANEAASSASAAAGSANTADAHRKAAETSKNAAANSASAADASSVNAKASESKVDTFAKNAANAANAAKTSETNAVNAANAAKTSETTAINAANTAKTSETNANKSANAAKASETNAANSANAAKTSETNTANSANAAKVSETNATNSENAAKASKGEANAFATNAANSAAAAKVSETSAANSANTADDLAKTIATKIDTAEKAIADANAAKVDIFSVATSAKKTAQDALNSAKAVEQTISTAITNATNAVNAAKASEANAANSATAAKTSEANAANSADAAKASESKAVTSSNAAKASEDKSATFAANAANSANAAKTSETNTTNAANAAKVSETNAANSANVATTARNQADGFKNAAEAAKNTTEARWNEFNKIYYGARATPPTGAISIGALWLDTSVSPNVLKQMLSTGWKEVVPKEADFLASMGSTITSISNLKMSNGKIIVGDAKEGDVKLVDMGRLENIRSLAINENQVIAGGNGNTVKAVTLNTDAVTETPTKQYVTPDQKKTIDKADATYFPKVGGVLTGSVVLDTNKQWSAVVVKIPDGDMSDNGFYWLPKKGGKETHLAYRAGGGIRMYIKDAGEVLEVAPNNVIANKPLLVNGIATIGGSINIKAGQWDGMNITLTDGNSGGNGLTWLPQKNGASTAVAYSAGGGARIWVEGGGNVLDATPSLTTINSKQALINSDLTKTKALNASYVQTEQDSGVVLNHPGGIKTILRGDENAFHVLFSDVNGSSFNALRPLSISKKTGATTMSHDLTARANFSVSGYTTFGNWVTVKDTGKKTDWSVGYRIQSNEDPNYYTEFAYAGGGARIWVNGIGNVAIFRRDGVTEFMKEIQIGGNGVLQTDGNIRSSLWSSGHLHQHIENRCWEIANDRRHWSITDSRVAGWAENGVGWGWNHLPSGYFATASHRMQYNGAVVQLGGRQLQLFMGGRGWFQAGGW